MARITSDRSPTGVSSCGTSPAPRASLGAAVSTDMRNSVAAECGADRLGGALHHRA